MGKQERLCRKEGKIRWQKGVEKQKRPKITGEKLIEIPKCRRFKEDDILYNI